MTTLPVMKFALILLACFCFATAVPAQTTEKSPRALYEALSALRVDASNVYSIDAQRRLELRRPDLQITFEEGKLAFLSAFEGQLTGVVFSGRGHVLATPRDALEKQQIARFLGAPMLDEEFYSGYFRFTDGAGEELLHQLQTAEYVPHSDEAFGARWESYLARLNPSHALRMLEEMVSANPKHYFQAGLDGLSTGPFDVVFDQSREEPLLLGQTRKNGNTTFYDVWASYQPSADGIPVIYRASHYDIAATIRPDNSLEGETTIRLRSEIDGERLVVFQLSRALKVESVSNSDNAPLIFFQNEGMTVQQRNAEGSDFLYVFLREATKRGREFSLHFKYRGNVIEDAGNGVLFVGAREEWYPRFGDTSQFADYDLNMRWPKKLRMVATGIAIEEHEEGEFRVGHWRSDKPLPIAGFNLGDYASASLTAATNSVDVYANRQLETALSRRLTTTVEGSALDNFGRLSPGAQIEIIRQAPSPADELKNLGREIETAILFYQKFSGPFPYRRLSVSQIPGTFGQGWPGLLYLSTLSFLSPAAQERAGIAPSVQERFTEIVPYHEVAHQWWGNVVGWRSYRDQWIDEAIANYLALLFAESQKKTDHTLRVWLERFRKQLVDKYPEADIAAADIGPLYAGSRLNSSKSPYGYETVIYAKGAWVIHMLREMLRQPGTTNPDARFNALLKTISEKYAYRAFTTEDFQREVEAVMTPKMDLEGGRSMEWFFDQWVKGTGVPHYQVEFTARRATTGYQIRGKLLQTGVPRSFIASVPIYAAGGAGKNVLLGNIIASGPETAFHFNVPAPPHKILIDPQMTLLCTSQ
ncbi:MAG TPA: M1 family aminopeptidase [Candidatus Dormibacteraeota bacterium]|nr:M1 family aminopeptidase [Candidatus Dormibacteraeota bacterium]